MFSRAFADFAMTRRESALLYIDMLPLIAGRRLDGEGQLPYSLGLKNPSAQQGRIYAR
jgi:hypothetical protein